VQGASQRESLTCRRPSAGGAARRRGHRALPQLQPFYYCRLRPGARCSAATSFVTCLVCSQCEACRRPGLTAHAHARRRTSLTSHRLPRTCLLAAPQLSRWPERRRCVARGLSCCWFQSLTLCLTLHLYVCWFQQPCRAAGLARHFAVTNFAVTGTPVKCTLCYKLGTRGWRCKTQEQFSSSALCTCVSLFPEARHTCSALQHPGLARLPRYTLYRRSVSLHRTASQFAGLLNLLYVLKDPAPQAPGRGRCNGIL